MSASECVTAENSEDESALVIDESDDLDEDIVVDDDECHASSPRLVMTVSRQEQKDQPRPKTLNHS